MEERHIKVKGVSPCSLTPKQRDKMQTEIGNHIKEIFMSQIREVYLINSQIRTKGNYLPLEDVLSAIRVDFSKDTDSYKIYIDIDSLCFQDSSGNPLFFNKNMENLSSQGVIDNFEDHWYTPIEGMKEMDWAITTTIDKSTEYIKQYYNQITNKMGRTQK